MRLLAGKPLLVHTLERLRRAYPATPIVIAAPAFDAGNLDAFADAVPGCAVRYGFDDKPLLRMVAATEALDADAVVVRLDGQSCFFQEPTLAALAAELRARDLDLVRAPDDYPPPLTGDVWRVGALRRMADLLGGLPAEDAAPHYVHAKFLAMRPEADLRTASLVPPTVPDETLRAVRAALTETLLDHIDVTDKAIPAGDQLSFHYRLACRHIEAGSHVLDIAAGKGFGGHMLARAGCRVVCADIDAAKLDEGRALFAHPALTFSHQDVLNMDFADGSFDAVVSMETVEHMADVDRYFAELRRVLRPGGLLILSTPQNGIGHIPLTPSHEVEYDLDQFRALCAGRFEVRQIIGLKAGTISFPDDPVGANSMAVLRKAA